MSAGDRDGGDRRDEERTEGMSTAETDANAMTTGSDSATAGPPDTTTDENTETTRRTETLHTGPSYAGAPHPAHTAGADLPTEVLHTGDDARPGDAGATPAGGRPSPTLAVAGALSLAVAVWALAGAPAGTPQVWLALALGLVVLGGLLVAARAISGGR